MALLVFLKEDLESSSYVVYSSRYSASFLQLNLVTIS
jgi:hypothetical protein